MAEIKVKGGFVTHVDDEMLEECGKRRWHLLSGKGYVVHRLPGNRKLFLGRFVMGLEEGNPGRVSYKDGDFLNNRRENLVVGGRVGCKWKKRRGFLGVGKMSESGKWPAVIHLEGRSCQLGYFANPEQAARVFDAASRFYFGHLARTNFPGDEAMSLEQIRKKFFPRVVHLPQFVEPAPKQKKPWFGPRRSRFKGVSWTTSIQRWRAKICVCGIYKYLGNFKSEEAAAEAYKAAIKKYRGKKVKPTSEELERRLAESTRKQQERSARRYAENRDQMLKESKDSRAAWSPEKKAEWREYQKMRETLVRTDPEAWRRWRLARRVSRRIARGLDPVAPKRRRRTKIRTHADRAREKGCAVSGDREAYKQFIFKVRSAHKVRCYWCNQFVPKSERRIDHIIPLDKGGPDDVMNLCCSCVHCNSVKHNKLPEEFCGQSELFPMAPTVPI